MAAPTFVAWTNTAGATLVEPTGTTSGDTILAIVNSTTSPTGPSGWSQIGASRTAGGEIATAWSIVRGGSAPALTWSGTIDGGLLTTFRGAAATFDASAQSAAGSAVSPTVTTTVADCLIVSLFADAASSTITAPSGMTLTDGFFDASAYVAQASAGASGTKTWGGTSTPIGAWTIALKPDGIDFTGTATVSVSGSGASLMTGMTATSTVAVAGSSGALLLGAGMTSTRTVAVGGASAALSVISRVFVGILEIEFTAGVWTDVSSRFRQSLTIHQGRVTEFDDVGAGSLSCTLWNDDGALTPDNTGSTYYPDWVEGKRIRWKVSKSGTTYTRFVGWITAILPDFPTGSTHGAMVSVTATDALGLLALRRLRSSWTERALSLARAGGVTSDACEAIGAVNGFVAQMTNFSTDAGAQVGTYVYSTVWPTLTFGNDRDVSVGGTVSCNPDSNSNTSGTIPLIQAGSKTVRFVIKTPTQIPAVGLIVGLTSLHQGSFSPLMHICVENNGAADMQLSVYNLNQTVRYGVLQNPVVHGQWILVSIVQAGTATQLNVTSTILGTGTTASVNNIAVDIRNFNSVGFPGSFGPFSSSSFGGVVALGQTTGPAAADAIPNGAQGTLSTRLDHLTAACSALPVTFAKVGSLSTQVLTGQWSRYALEVLQEMMRSNSGLAWARSRDSVVHLVDAASCRPASPVATIDTDADCSGPPRLARAVESRPTRIQVDTPAGTTIVVDATAEAGPGTPQRLKTVAPVNASTSDATPVANALLASSTRLRITRVVVDLTTGVTDHTAALLSEAGTLSGLYPTQRVRFTVPASHFGSSTVDAYVQGWTERYAPQGVTVELDTTPA